MTTIQKTDRILIIGAGCFGVSTAYHLLKRGFTDITILDRSETLPAPDAASTDLNKVVRSSYADIFYATLAQEAIREWKEELWGNTYHESGVLVLGKSSGSDEPYNNISSYPSDAAIGARLKPLKDGKDISSIFPAGVRTASFENLTGYLNLDGGWANAAEGVLVLTRKAVELGAKIEPGKKVHGLLRKDGKTTGVQCKDGTNYEADLTILATGAWTASAFPELDLDSQLVASGQCIATIKLSRDEAILYKDCPVILDFSSGFYMFPPNENDIVKMAFDKAGYSHMVVHSISNRPISTPRTVSSHPEDGLYIPREAARMIQDKLRDVYPELARKPFVDFRLCWYTNTADNDWIIGPHPSDPSLFFATAGNGHAYKFLPVIGRLVADAVEGTLEPSLVQKFAPARTQANTLPERRCIREDGVQELDLDDLCSPEHFNLGKQ